MRWPPSTLHLVAVCIDSGFSLKKIQRYWTILLPSIYSKKYTNVCCIDL